MLIITNGAFRSDQYECFTNWTFNEITKLSQMQLAMKETRSRLSIIEFQKYFPEYLNNYKSPMSIGT